ncbi:MFS transporter [Glutamicibacter sp. PS]|uniref:MFS transporter n=1 Tax=Glutamicibacter sp. PS TaxID=3075634 RepID=UPI00283E3577|nr:MFS transporter [Glutamicibacter sp. PS]MDR4534157.1 MFS transporter [Glutamicibacter sp. PS]
MVSHRSRSGWWFPAVALVLTGWCANQYVPLMGWYQQERGLSELASTLVLASYVLGLLPALLFGGNWADRYGRKPFTLVALGCSLTASLVMMLGQFNPLGLYAGRVLTGLGMGLAMVAATTWVKQSAGAKGASRAGLSTSLGFALGPVLSAAIVGMSGSPEVAYAAHAASTLLWFIPLWLLAAEMDTRQAVVAAGPGTSTQNMRRFTWIVLPMAPWVFGLATSGFAIVPALVNNAQGPSLLVSTATVAFTMGMGVLVQPLVERFNRPDSVRMIVLGLVVGLVAYAFIVLAALTGQVFVGLLGSFTAGCANGILLKGGLTQVLDLAAEAEAGKLTGRFYAMCYVGFLFPTLMALFRNLGDPLYFVLLLALACGLCLLLVLAGRRFLPGRGGLQVVKH